MVVQAQKFSAVVKDLIIVFSTGVVSAYKCVSQSGSNYCFYMFEDGVNDNGSVLVTVVLNESRGYWEYL